MKKSRYNFEFRFNGNLYIYNAKNKNIIELDNEYSDIYENISVTNDCRKQELELFLEEQGMLVPNELDEFIKIDNKRNLRLTVFPTEECNFRCDYCYEENISVKLSNKLQDNILKFIESKKNDFDIIHIAWFGGEPLLEHKMILRFMENVNTLIKKYGKKVYGSITTNGFLLSKQIFIELVNVGIVSFQITLDGDERQHNLYRKLHSGDGTFRQIYNNLLACKDSELEFFIIIRCNFGKSTNVKSLIDILADDFRKDDRFMLFFKEICDLDNKGRDYLVDLNDILTMKNDYNMYAIRQGLKLIEAQRLFGMSTNCYASEIDSFTIRANGTIQKCTVDLNNHLNSIGNVVEFDKINSKLNKLWSDSFMNNFCDECSLYYLCAKMENCPLSRIKLNDKNIIRKINYCDEQKEQIMKLLEYYILSI